MPEVRLDHGQRLPIGLKSLDTASSRLDQETSPLAGGIAIQSQALSRIGQRLLKSKVARGVQRSSGDGIALEFLTVVPSYPGAKMP